MFLTYSGSVETEILNFNMTGRNVGGGEVSLLVINHNFIYYKVYMTRNLYTKDIQKDDLK